MHNLLRGILAGAAALLTAGGVALASPASAAVTTETVAGSTVVDRSSPRSVETQATPAPDCIKRWVRDLSPYVEDLYVDNNCGRGYYLRVVVDWADDSECKYVPWDHIGQLHWWYAQGSYAGLYLC